MTIEITDDMLTAGEDVLAAQGENVDARDLVKAIYLAMAEKAPPAPGAGKAEPPPTFEGAPANVTQIAPKR